MIPLNKPLLKPWKNFIKDNSINCFDDFRQKHFNEYFSRYLYSSRNGLQVIYRYLYEKHGPLRVAVSPLTCFEALYPIANNHHKIVFVDIDPDTFNLDERLLEQTDNINVVQPIHFGGNPQNMMIIDKWAKERDVIIVEDCAQSLGSFIGKRHTGTFGDYSVFSFVKTNHTKLGSLFLSKHEINSLYKRVPKKIVYYKSLKRWLERKCSFNNYSVFNLLYKNLLILKEEKKEKYNSNVYSSAVRLMNELDNSIVYFEAITKKRVEISNVICNSIDQGVFIPQKEIEGGVSNKNRLLFKSNSKDAFSVITYLRKKGIAANNLTQSYLAPFQHSVDKEDGFKKWYKESPLKVYKELHPYIFSVPNSPALNSKEIEHIITSLNKIIDLR